jgi:hypothetical protein
MSNTELRERGLVIHNDCGQTRRTGSPSLKGRPTLDLRARSLLTRTALTAMEDGAASRPIFKGL